MKAIAELWGDFEPVSGCAEGAPRAPQPAVSENAYDVRKAGQHRRQADAQAHDGDVSLDLDGIVFHLTVLRPMTFTLCASGHTAAQPLIDDAMRMGLFEAIRLAASFVR